MTERLTADVAQLKSQVAQLERLVRAMLEERAHSGTDGSRRTGEDASSDSLPPLWEGAGDAEGEPEGAVFYSGRYRNESRRIRFDPRERSVEELLGLNADKASKVLAALGHKQRLDLLRTVLSEPLSGSELVHRLNMGTTGQLYHHVKALLGADLLVQERGKYALPEHRTLPVLLLLAAVSDLADAGDYLEMEEARNNASVYLGAGSGGYDPHLLLWAVVENSILEHRAAFCDAISIFVHDNGSVTVSDNGRGIPVNVLPHTGKSAAQSVLTEISRFAPEAAYVAPGAEKGIGIALVNALSERLSVEIRRDGEIHRQDYRHGIPESGLLTVGMTEESGTSVTFRPDRDLFPGGFDRSIVESKAAELTAAYPGLSVRVK